MARIRTLMLGWEFPPFINGGLGVACEGLVNALAPRSELSLFLPKFRNSASKKKIQIIPTHYLTHPGRFRPISRCQPDRRDI
jgi:hypothetical protein